jgi:hypothetical protein
VAGALLLLAWLAFAADDSITLRSGDWTVKLSPSTLAAEASSRSGLHATLSRAALDPAPVSELHSDRAQARWTLPKQALSVFATLGDEGFRLTFRTLVSDSVTWPVVGEEPGLEGVALPRGEGFYVPIHEARWRDFLVDQSPFDTTEALSMPVVGLRYSGLTVAYIAGNPYDTALDWQSNDGELRMRMTHHFVQPIGEHSVLVRFGGTSPVEAAVLFRQSLWKDRPPKTRPAWLFGAAHIYLWGGGVSPEMMRRLHEAGFDRLWLGVESAQAPAVELARQYGYLIAPYDSYHSIHSPTEKATWATAQFDRKLYETGAIVNRDGSRSVGFNGKGYHLSSNAAFPYVVRRVEGILREVPYNSWFVDCDATGELFQNYSTQYFQTKEQDMFARLQRLNWIRDQKHLVVGSEGGAWYAAFAIDFAHGMMSPLFGWRDPLLHDPQSKYFLGRYYPPDGPAIFMKRVELPEKYLSLYYDPRYRLPLFQAAFHDEVVTTNHWSQSSLKFTNAAQVRELLELLYGVPPLYHLNLKTFDSIVPAIQTHYRFFSPLHREIGAMAMSKFEWLSADRLLQKTVFGGQVEVVANFGETEARYDGTRIPARSVSVRRLGERELKTYSPAR